MKDIHENSIASQQSINKTVSHRNSCASQGNHETCSPTHECCDDAQMASPDADNIFEQLPSLVFPPSGYNKQYKQGAKTRMLQEQYSGTSSTSSTTISNSFLIPDIKDKEESKESNNNKSKQSSIDFGVLETFAKSHFENDLLSKNYYKPAENNGFFSRHRPLVPQSILQSTANVYYDDFSACFAKDFSGNGSEDNGGQFEKCIRQHIYDDDMAEKNYEMDSDEESMERRKSFTMDRFTFFNSRSEMKPQGPTLGTLISNGQTFEDLFTSEKNIWWLDCLDPTPAELKTLGRAFGIHPLTIDDIRQKETHEKVELFQNYYFLCFNSFNNDKNSDHYLDPINVYFVVFREGVISFHFTPISHTGNVRRRVRQLRDYVNVSSDWLCYALLDDITDSFVPLMKKLEVEIDFIEESVYFTRKPDFYLMIRRIGENRNIINLMLRLLSRKADVIKMFAKRCQEQYTNAPQEEIVLYLGDIQAHIITMKQSLAVYEKMLSQSHANYLAQLQVESVDSNNRVTKVLGRVTLIGTILVPLNLVTGLFGMNVRVPGQSGEDLKWFFGVIGFIVTLVIVFSLIANHWVVEAEKEEIVVSKEPNQGNQTLRKAAQKLNPFARGDIHKRHEKNY